MFVLGGVFICKKSLVFILFLFYTFYLIRTLEFIRYKNYDTSPQPPQIFPTQNPCLLSAFSDQPTNSYEVPRDSLHQGWMCPMNATTNLFIIQILIRKPGMVGIMKPQGVGVENSKKNISVATT